MAIPLHTDLIAFWPGNEASGNLIDAHTNGLDLADVNTVTNGAGPVYATARQFNAAADEYFWRADSALLSTGDVDFTLAAWVYLSEGTSERPVLGKWNTDPNNEHLLLYIKGTGLRFYVSDNGTAAQFVTETTQGNLTLNTWYFAVVWHDSVANTINIQVNDNTPDSTAHSTGVHDSSAQFMIGERDDNSGAEWHGRIGPAMFWKRVLTSAERTALYGGGSGLKYADFPSADPVVPDTPRLDDWNVELVDLDTGATYILRDEISGITSLKMEPGATRPKLLSGSLTCSAGTSANPSYVAQSLKWGGWQALRFVPYADTSKEFWGLIAKQQESYSRRPGQIPITLAPIGYLLHSRVIYHVTGGEAVPISGASLTVDDYAKKLVRYSALPGTVTNDLDGNSRDWGWGTLAVQADASASAESMGVGHVGIDDFKQFLDDVLNALPNIDIELYWELLPTVAAGALTFTFNTSVAVGTDRTSGADRWVINDFAGEAPTGERTEDKIGIYNAQHAGGLGHIELDAASVAAYGRWESVTDAQEDEGVKEDAKPGLPKVGHTVTYAVVKDWMVFWDVGDTMLRSNERLGITETSERLAFVEMSAAASDKLIKLDLTWGDREVQQSKKERGGRGGTLTPRKVSTNDIAGPVSVGGANAWGVGYYLVRDDHVHQLNIDIPATVSPLLGVFSLESADNSVVITTPGAGRIDLAGGGPGTYHNLLNGTEHPDTRNAAATPGDIIFADGSSLWQRRAKGTDDQILTLISGLPDWADALWTQGPNVGGAAVQGLYPTTVADVVSIGAAAYTAGVDAPRAATFLQVHGAIAVKRYVHNPESSLVIYGRDGGQSRVHVGEVGLPDGRLDVFDVGGTARWRADASTPYMFTHGWLDVRESGLGASKVRIDADDGNGKVSWEANVLASFEGTTYRWPTDAPALGETLMIGTAAATNLLIWANPSPAAHKLLSVYHSDTAANIVTQGSLIYGNATPKWGELEIGAASTLLRSNGTDPSWGTVNLLSAYHTDTVSQGAVRGAIIRGNATPAWGWLAAAAGVLMNNATDVTGWTMTPTLTSMILSALTVNGNITVSGTVDGVDILNHTHNYDKADSPTATYVAGASKGWGGRVGDSAGGTIFFRTFTSAAAANADTPATGQEVFIEYSEHTHVITFTPTASGIPN